MRILILAASLPYPPTSGGALRTYGIIKGLADAGHELSLLSFGESPHPALERLCQQVELVPSPKRSKIGRLRDLLLGHADIAKRFYSQAFEAKLLALIKATDYDLIQFEGIEIACYLPIVKKAQVRAKLCFDTFNAEAALQRLIFEIDRQETKRILAAAYSYIQSKRIARYEAQLCREADFVLAVSAEDAAILKKYRKTKPIFVLPSGIFVADYAANPRDENLNLGENALVFTGKMDYRPNVDAMLWFAESILPKIKEANLVIVGQQTHPRLDVLRQNPKIQMTGWVKSVTPYLRSADVYVAPLRMGSGTRLKLLEAMACGCAIVATPTAASGLCEEALEGMMIAESEKLFADIVKHLLGHPSKQRELGAKAQALVRAHYDWSVLIPQLLRIYQEAGLG